MLWLYLTSGLFLGWSLGANDASNIFGSAVSTRMLKFTTAAILSSVFIVLGATISGSGATHTLGVLGEVNALAGSFTVALAAAFSAYSVIKRGLPVSISQTIVGAIIGWNIFTSSPTDYHSLYILIISWVINPILAGLFSFLIYNILKHILNKLKLHILELDVFYRTAFIIIVAFGSYALGANNIANVVGVFLASSPFRDFHILPNLLIPASFQLYLTGAIAIVVGVLTFSQKTIHTVNERISKLTPVSALSAVLAASLVLYLFSSVKISGFLVSVGLFPFPLAPVSLTQGVVGAVVGIGLAKGGRYFNYKLLGRIAAGWVITPVASALLSLLFLFVMQNVFQQKVYNPFTYELSYPVIEKLKDYDIQTDLLKPYEKSTYKNQSEFMQFLNKVGIKKEQDVFNIFSVAKMEKYIIDSNYAKLKLGSGFTAEELHSIAQLHNKTFYHNWQIVNALRALDSSWEEKPPNTIENLEYNKQVQDKLNLIFSVFKIHEE
jgi:PiT family inorganic phosphate transporter